MYIPRTRVNKGKKEAFRTRNRSVRRVAQRLHRIARRKGEKARLRFAEQVFSVSRR